MNRAAFVLIVGAAALWTVGCGHSAPTEPEATPAWLQGLIAQIEKEPVTNPPSAIYSYRYRGETVYFRPSRCCDIRSVVYEKNGAVLCEPDGGIAGIGDPRCADFFQARSGEQLVWRDPRG